MGGNWWKLSSITLQQVKLKREKESLRTLSARPYAQLSLEAILTAQFPLSQIFIFCSSYLLHRETNVLCSGNLILNDEYEIVLSSDSFLK